MSQPGTDGVAFAVGARMALREFTDEEGKAWTVWSTIPDLTAGTHRDMQAGWLTFECDGVRKRLAPIPPNWERATTTKLCHYCKSAESFAPRYDQGGR